ncbi:hypothetical protein QYE76_036405 [Lolium multiflorum]|uniref:Protein kinase domain-containing protein n=1 Tax=Lolium multiflorum TaxID=4521 RepID=A0AAD8R2Q9_LOLMU|nr:hypothetical protein QYE76_036405 [Lolium multiflorum]
MAGDGELAGAARLLLLLLATLVAVAAAAGPSEADVLLSFRATLRGPTGDRPPAPLDQWVTSPGSGPCGLPVWYAVRCHPVTNQVLVLRLEYLGLQGAAPDMAPLAGLPGLRSLSFANNNLTGAFPAGLSKLGMLKLLYLSRNRLSGDIPDDAFAAMKGLMKLYLTNNDFTGHIPGSIVTSPKLLVLQLSKNRFDGPMPDLDQKGLQLVDVSNNNLSGPVPEQLQRFGVAAFQGNEGMCGPPLAIACPPASPIGASSPSSDSSNSLKILMIIAIAVVAVGGLLAIAGIILALLARRKDDATETLGGSGDAVTAAKLQATAEPAIKIEKRDMEQTGSVTAVPAKRGGRRDGLVFLQEGGPRFELEDLLRASAEVLGSGNFGASYKATLLDGASMVVKRFKEMNGAARQDFNEHMRRLGRLSHPNLNPVVAYLYKKDEKLFVTEHKANGGLAAFLHGGERSGLPKLDWAARLRIVKGVARALAYLYEELPMLTVPHGHLKSSNVLLDDALEPVLSDYALVPVVTPQHASQVMVAYKSPECAAAQGGKASKKSDVWTLGILVLELLTGKFPANYLRKGRDQDTMMDLAGWVNSVVREEWTGEVFDKDMGGTRSAEGEMVKLLKVGLACCDADVAARWDIKEALARIEEVRERDPDDSSTASSYLSDGVSGAGDQPNYIST